MKKESVLYTTYADMASIVINGVHISTGSDGMFYVVFVDEKPENVEETIWFDFRTKQTLTIWESDCDPNKYEMFSSEDFDNANVIGIGFNTKTDELNIWKAF